MKIHSNILEFKTKGHTDIVDLTRSIQKALNDTGFKNGQVTVFAIGSTTGISTLEYEPGLVNTDVKAMFQKIAPYGSDYIHNKTWGDDNGAAHLRSLLTGTSYVVPFIEGKLMLGTWQQVVFIDFDTRQRQRKVVLQFTGD